MVCYVSAEQQFGNKAPWTVWLLPLTFNFFVLLVLSMEVWVAKSGWLLIFSRNSLKGKKYSEVTYRMERNKYQSHQKAWDMFNYSILPRLDSHILWSTSSCNINIDTMNDYWAHSRHKLHVENERIFKTALFCVHIGHTHHLQPRSEISEKHESWFYTYSTLLRFLSTINPKSCSLW